MRIAFMPAAVVLALACAVPALADGDPASDYLLAQSTFLSPYDGHIPAAEANRLVAMLKSAKEQGFPLKLAVIVTRYDLGAVPILFRRPQTYAKFLAEEDYYYWRDELLVVMPNGYGLYKTKNLPVADKAVIAKLPAVSSTSGAELATAAERALTALAARRGLTLATSSSKPQGSSVWVERGEIIGGAVLVCFAVIGGRILWRHRAGVRR